MKNLVSHPFKKVLLAIGFLTILCAFASVPGAHAVKVYLDDELIVDEYLGSKKMTPSLALSASDRHQKLIVKYSECGRTVSGRKLTAKDDKNNLLKEWRFDGTFKGFDGDMECSVKDIVSLKKAGIVNLFYSSNDFPEGQPFLSITIGAARTSASR